MTAAQEPGAGAGAGCQPGREGSAVWLPDAARWPPVIGFVGPRNSGKTTLLERLLPIWRGRGLRVGAIKHAHHALRAGDPRTDSERLRAAGAAAVLACGAAVPWSEAIGGLLEEAAELDFVVCEGYHGAPVVQLLVLPSSDSLEQEIARARGWVIGTVVPGAGSRDAALPSWDREDAPALAAAVASHCRAVPGAGARVAAAVLAGGASRRMGSDKASLRWGGSTWLERARRAAGHATGGTALVVGGRGSEPWRVPDLLPGQGPLGALAAAWYHSRTPWLLLCACDMPLLRAPALATLLDHIPDGGDLAAVLPVIGGRRQYTCGAYARRGWPAAVAALGAGTRALRAWVDALPVLEVGEQAWRDQGIDPVRAFADLDDPQAIGAWRGRA